MGDGKSQKSTKRKNKQPPTPVKQTPSSSTQDPSKTNKNEECKIQLLEERIIQLEKKVEMLESTLIIAQNTNTLLEKEVDDLHQYQRRACIVVDGIQPEDNETEDQIKHKVRNVLTKNLGFEANQVNNEIDKCHRLGEPNRGKQSTIIRFRTHAFRAAVYQKRKTITNNKLKVKLSLTKKRIKTLTQAYKMVESNQQVKFVFADINGNLKLRLIQPIEHNKYTYTFDTIVDLEDLFERFGWDIPKYDEE